MRSCVLLPSLCGLFCVSETQKILIPGGPKFSQLSKIAYVTFQGKSYYQPQIYIPTHLFLPAHPPTYLAPTKYLPSPYLPNYIVTTYLVPTYLPSTNLPSYLVPTYLLSTYLPTCLLSSLTL